MSMPVYWLDVVILFLLVLGLGIGYAQGLVRQAIGLAALYIGAILGAQSGVPTGKKIPAGEVFWGSPARPLAKAKEQFAWAARLPELAERITRLEDLAGKK